MVFSDTTNKNGLIQDCELLLNFPDAGISGDTTLIKQFTGFINQAYLKVISWILENDTKWQWDDSNYSDFPRGVGTLVSGQKDYTLPVASSGANASTLLKVVKIAVLDKGSPTQEVVLTPSNAPESQLNNAYSTSGLPKVYKLVGNSIKMFPAPDNNVSVTLASGLIVYFQRSPDLFTSSDTTQQPGIPEPFHRLITLEASMDYASARGLPNMQYLQAKAVELRESFQGVMSQRNNDNKTRMLPRREKYF